MDHRTLRDHLDQLSTEQLEDLLRADLSSTDQRNEETVFYILDEMKRREQEAPTGRLPDVAQAWADFRQYYEIPEGADRSLYPCGPVPEEDWDTAPAVPSARPRRLIKRIFAVAAILVAMLCGMVTVQAAGVDVFGALGRWSEETFRFDFSTAAPSDIEANASFEEAVSQLGIPRSLSRRGSRRASSPPSRRSSPPTNMPTTPSTTSPAPTPTKGMAAAS